MPFLRKIYGMPVSLVDGLSRLCSRSSKQHAAFYMAHHHRAEPTTPLCVSGLRVALRCSLCRYLDLWPCGSDDRLHLERLLGWKAPAMLPPAASPPPAAVPSPAAPPLQPPPKHPPAQVRDWLSPVLAMQGAPTSQGAMLVFPSKAEAYQQ